MRPSLSVQLVKNSEQDGRMYKESDAARYGKYSNVFKNLWFADTVCSTGNPISKRILHNKRRFRDG